MKKSYQAVLFSESGSFIYSRSLGVHRIANILRNYFGWNVLVLDHFTVTQCIEKFKNSLIDDLLPDILNSETKLIGFSTTFMNFNSQWLVDQLPKDQHNFIDHPILKGSVDCLPFTTDDQAETFLAYLKSLAPNSKTVIGGVKAETKKYLNYVDAYVVGYGESQLIDLIKYWQGINPFMPIKKLSNTCLEISHDTKGTNYDFTSDRTKFVDDDLITKGEVLPLEISRGCIFRCKFCSYPLNGKKKWDYIKQYNILREEFIENYNEHGTTNYIIVDDTFNDSVEKLQLFHKVVQSLPFAIQYGAYIRHDLLNAHRETIPLLKESGLISATFGIETLNYESGKSIGKGMHPDKTLEFLHEIRSDWPELITSSGFILGLPFDTKESVEQMCKTLVQKDFPLDEIKIVPLWLQKDSREKKLYFSEFENHWETYGYTFKENNREWFKNDLSYTYCLDLSMKYHKILFDLKRNKIATFDAIAALNFNYTIKELKSICQKDFFKNFVPKRISYVENYYNNLQNYLKRQ